MPLWTHFVCEVSRWRTGRGTRDTGAVAHPLMFDEDDPILGRLRALCAALPESTERTSHGRPIFRAGAKGRVYATYGGGVKLRPGVHEPHPHALIFMPEQSELEAFVQDERFFRPAYYGPFGWFGLDLDSPDLDWGEVAELLDASFRVLAPSSLVRLLDARA